MRKEAILEECMSWVGESRSKTDAFFFNRSTVRSCKLVSLAVVVCLFCLLIVIVSNHHNLFYQIHGHDSSPQKSVAEKGEKYVHMELFIHPWTGRSLRSLFQDMRPFTIQTDYDYLQQHIESAGLNLSQMAQLKLDYEPLEIETELLKDGPLLDPYLVPNETYSRVTLINSRPEYTVGHMVTVRVDVRDGYNRQMSRGGDIVWVWLVEREKSASMAMDVEDLKNGTYLAHIPIQWTGFQQVKVSIRYPRETLRALLYSRHVMKSLRYVAAGFIGAIDSESTLCSPFPRIPGYTKLCNFSRRNYGQSWYCGHPRKLSLGCADWKIMRDIEFPKPLPLTAAEDVALIKTLLPHKPRLVLQKVILPVTSGQYHPPPSCSKDNFTDTWFNPAPRGFFIHKTWIPIRCSVPPPHVQLWKQCLRNTHVVLAGDSNLLMWFQHIKKRIKCKESRMRQDTIWHTPLTCKRNDINFSMKWQLHGYPEHPNSNHWAHLYDFRSACERIDGISSTGRYLVIVHLYIHFTIHHYSVFINRVKCVRRAIQDLLDRNPATRVMIRAPHTAYKGWNPIYGGEMTVPLYIDILRREFKGLYEKVIFLNLWDMTVAGENTDYHPDDWIDQQMVNYALGHACIK